MRRADMQIISASDRLAALVEVKTLRELNEAVLSSFSNQFAEYAESYNAGYLLFLIQDRGAILRLNPETRTFEALAFFDTSEILREYIPTHAHERLVSSALELTYYGWLSDLAAGKQRATDVTPAVVLDTVGAEIRNGQVVLDLAA